MKKLMYIFTAIATMFAVSCTQEMTSDVLPVGGEEATLSFAVEAPQLGSRAYGDGLTATKLYYAVYYGETLIEEASCLSNPLAIGTNGAWNLEVKLATGLTYDFIFWATSEEAIANGVYGLNWNEQTMTIDPAVLLAQDESLDAFYAKKTIKVEGNQTEGVGLYRPFAQINVATSDKELAEKVGLNVVESYFKVKAYTTLNLASGAVSGQQDLTYAMNTVPTTKLTSNGTEYDLLGMTYVLVNERETVDVEFGYNKAQGGEIIKTHVVPMAPVQRNYRTNIVGEVLTSTQGFTVTIEEAFADNDYEVALITMGGQTFSSVEEAINAAATSAEEDVTLTLHSDVTEDLSNVVVPANKDLTLDLNGKTLTSTVGGAALLSRAAENQILFDVRGTMTVKNGTIDYTYEGENMGWAAMATIFNVTAGGELNLEKVTAKIKGTDMAFVAHLNNWGEVTLNANECTLESTYVPVRVFNSGPDMNNVTITNSALKGVSAAFWVHNYTAVDFGSEAKAEAQKQLLNLAIYKQGNTFSPDVDGIRYGFTNSIRTDAYGITRVVSEDGATVTLGSLLENGLVRRGVAGAEENTTITKVVVEEGIANLYDRTFRRFYALETVELPSTLTTIGEAGSGVFQSCTNLKNIVLPESVTVLGKGSFQECSSLTSINIPAGVTRIEADALRASGLVEVEFHAGVTYFGAQAFRDCKSLTKVVIKAPEFTMEGNTFGIMAAPFTPMTIEVANAEMKAYVESKLTAHAKTYITVIAPEVATNAVEFIAAVNNIVDGGTVIVGESFSFTDEEGGRTNNGGWWDGLGYSGDKSFTIDLNGKTIGNANGVLNDYLFWFKNDGEKASTITIKNGTLDAGTTAFCALCTASSGSQPLTINLEDVTLINNISNGSTIKARTASTTVNLKNGTKVIGKNSYLGVECWKATVNIYEGAEIYMNGTASYNGCLVGVGGNGVINVYGGYGKGVKGGFIAMTSGGTINVAGGEWIANTDGTVGNNSNLYVLTAQSNKYESGFAGPSVINVTGGTLRGGMDAWVLNNLPEEKAELNISGGNYNVNPSRYVVEGKTATEANGIWTVE